LITAKQALLSRFAVDRTYDQQFVVGVTILHYFMGAFIMWYDPVEDNFCYTDVVDAVDLRNQARSTAAFVRLVKAMQMANKGLFLISEKMKDFNYHSIPETLRGFILRAKSNDLHRHMLDKDRDTSTSDDGVGAFSCPSACLPADDSIPSTVAAVFPGYVTERTLSRVRSPFRSLSCFFLCPSDISVDSSVQNVRMRTVTARAKNDSGVTVLLKITAEPRVLFSGVSVSAINWTVGLASNTAFGASGSASPDRNGHLGEYPTPKLVRCCFSRAENSG
jgi:hypothetical protein